MDSPDVGSVILHRLERTRGTTISLKSFQAPEKARKPYQKAREELSRDKINYPKAMKYLKRAVKAYPGFATAWYELGKCHLIAGDSDSASQAFQASFEADPHYLLPLVDLADMALRAGRIDEAAVVSGYVVANDSEVVRAHYIRAWAEHGRGNIELARESILSVQESQDGQKYPGSNYLLGMILEHQGENEQAASHFRQFVKAQPDSPDAGHLRQLLDSWELQGLIPPGVSELP
jgi:Tfp pilus assembly protein PilF